MFNLILVKNKFYGNEAQLNLIEIKLLLNQHYLLTLASKMTTSIPNCCICCAAASPAIPAPITMALPFFKTGRG